MRVIGIILVWIVYLCCINVYILTFGVINQFISKLLYLWPGFITLVYCSIDIYIGATDFKHKCFLSLCLAAIAANFLIMIMYFQFGIINYQLRFFIFNGICLITSIFILISGLRNKLFKDNEIDAE